MEKQPERMDCVNVVGLLLETLVEISFKIKYEGQAKRREIYDKTNILGIVYEFSFTCKK